MQNKCYIVGCGGHGRVVLDILTQAAHLEVLGFLDSDPACEGTIVDDVRVVGQPGTFGEFCQHLATGASLGFAGYEPSRAIVAIGDNRARYDMAEALRTSGVDLINAIHPASQLPGRIELGQNVVIAVGVMLGTGCQIDDSVILNTGCIVDHGSWIGEAAHICPGAKLAGGVQVHPGAFIGTGAVIIPNIRVGQDAIVGAGAVVTRDVAARATVIGVPAREINSDAP